MNEETGKHLVCLDGWRGVAIVAVLLGHFALESRVPGLGVFGVDLFFVLSGRLMAEILFVRRAPLPTFFLRRFSRVYPALFIFVVVTTLAAAGTSYSHGMKAVLVALTFTINYAMIYTHPIGLLDHLWSLCVEEHAYILLALVAVSTARNVRFAKAAMLIVASVAITNAAIQTWWMHKGYFEVYWRSDVQVAPIFLAGALYLARDRIRLIKSSWVAPGALASGIVFKLVVGGVLGFALGTLLLAIAVVSIDYSAPVFRKFFEFRVLRRLGLLSYSLYLWQQPFYKLHRASEFSLSTLLVMLILATCCSYYLVERPARCYINQYFARI